MQNELEESAWLNEHYSVTLGELAMLSGLPDDILRELVDCGALAPVSIEAEHWVFSAHCVVTMRRAQRLRSDFELDANALAVALSFLERIHELEEQLRAARAQIPRRAR